MTAARRIALSPEDDALLDDLAARIAAKLRAPKRLPLLDAVPILRRGFERPDHLAAMASLFERAEAASRGDAARVRHRLGAEPGRQDHDRRGER